jgi:hypothetical protein
MKEFIITVLLIISAVYMSEFIRFTIFIYKEKKERKKVLKSIKYVLENKGIHSKIEIQKAQQELDDLEAKNN